MIDARAPSPGSLDPIAGLFDRRLILGPIAAADWLRRRWLHLLGGLARPLVRRRELRVAVMFSAIVLTALAGSLLLPFWLLIAAWAAVDLLQANHGYFRMARFHGHLELMAITLLLLERRAHAPGSPSTMR